ncbi:MAG: hypothetical protein J5760_00740 [Clostridia bacterium]|nr:hypothetical protein [Clostridia bacterium]
MKKAVLITLCALILVSLFACGGNAGNAGNAGNGEKKLKDPADVDVSAILRESVNRLNAGEGELYCSSPFAGAYEFDDDILSGKFGDLLTGAPECEHMVKYCAFFSDETYGPEYGAFLFDTPENAEEMVKYIKTRFADLIKNSYLYPSVDTALAENMTVFTDGNWVCYSAVKDNAAFRETFYAFAEE